MTDPQDRKLFHLCLRVIRANQHLIEVMRAQHETLNKLQMDINRSAGRKRSLTSEVMCSQEILLKLEEAAFELTCAWGDMIADFPVASS
jgi:hypothetical protein